MLVQAIKGSSKLGAALQVQQLEGLFLCPMLPGGCMKSEDQKISGFEIVMVKNEQINLFASLVTLENGKAVVHGQVILGREEKLQFSSDTHFKGALRSEFLSACQVIADFYGANLLRRKIPLSSAVGLNADRGSIPLNLLN